MTHGLSLGTKFLLILVLLLIAVYLLSLRSVDRIGQWMFWIVFSVGALGICIRIITLRRNLSRAEWFSVGCTIVLYVMALQILYAFSTGGFQDSDPHFDYAVAKQIGLDGELPAGQPEWLAAMAQWPSIHILAVELTSTLGIDLFQVARILPMILSAILVLVALLFAKRFCGDDKSALLGTFLFGSSFWFVWRFSEFHRETIAFLFLAFAVLTYFLYRSSGKRAFMLLFATFVLATVLSHPFASIMLSLVVVVDIASLWVLRRLRVPKSNEDGIFPNGATLTSLLFVAVFVFGYWSTLGNTPIQAITQTVQSYFAGADVGFEYSRISLRTQILNLGKYFFVSVFLLSILYGVLHSHGAQQSRRFATLVWGGLIGFLGLAFQFGFGTVASTRLLPYLYLIVIVSAVQSVQLDRSQMRRILVVSLAIGFSLFSLYEINPTFYSTEPPNLAQGIIRTAYLDSEYSAIEWIPQSNYVIGDWKAETLAVSLRFMGVTSDFGVFSGNFADLGVYEWMIIRQEMKFQIVPTRGTPEHLSRDYVRENFFLTEEVIHRMEMNPGINKVYANGEVDLFMIVASTDK